MTTPRRNSKPVVNPANVEPKPTVVGSQPLSSPVVGEAPKCEIHFENGRIVAACESAEDWEKLSTMIDEQPIIGRIQATAVLEEVENSQ